jgi:hypothetical protein
VVDAHAHLYQAPQREFSDSAHISGESSLLSILLLFFADIISLLVVETSVLPGVFVLDNGPSLCPDVIEVKMFAFLALTLEMAQTGGVLDEMEQLHCPFYGQMMVHLGYYHKPQFLHFVDNGRNVVDRMDESCDRLWTI